MQKEHCSVTKRSMCRHMPTGTVGTMDAPHRLTRIHILVTERQHARLTARSQASGRSVAQLIRGAIDDQIGRDRGPPGGMSGSLVSAGQRLLAAVPLAGERSRRPSLTEASGIDRTPTDAPVSSP